MESKTKKKLIVGGGLLLAVGAALLIKKTLYTIPRGVEAVKPFDISRFLGRWYDIACIDNRSTKNRRNSYSEFFVDRHGVFRVLQSYNDGRDNVCEEKLGRVRFASLPSVAKLMISFHGLLYSGYNVIEIDPEYQYALVAGDSMNQLRLLSRNTDMREEKAEQYLSIAASYGYDISRLVWMEHDDEYDLCKE